MPRKLYKIRKSPIHGKGVFATITIRKNQIIGTGINMHLGELYPIVTKDFGSLINHAPRKSRVPKSRYHSNTTLKYNPKKGEYSIVATKTIPKNSEILIDYRFTPWFIKKPNPEWDHQY